MRDALLLGLALGLLGCGASFHGRGSAYPRTWSARPSPGDTQQGLASYYSDALAGRATASGERYALTGLTAAHRELPFGTRLRVRRADNGRAVVVRVNDRGPYADPRRVIDLSRAAAESLGMIRAGVVPVVLEVLDVPARQSSRRATRNTD